ncbi:ureidoglycolate lyase [Silvimonas terrae]|uniref:Ureidoglycolate lyase n=1 Tax=Silvimonas terrae TaxID=300266 RepID=A0A840RLC6_9NEIS|nr:ureidoglycolate lyase [Silvimonas terrae]MBB5192993.1 ureidoglycolate lyase [Silvimonas terrae]
MSQPVALKVEPLTAAAFAPFGDVIEAADSARHFPINGGNTERFHDLMTLATDPDGHAIVSIFRGQPRTLPLTLTMLERHPKGSQAFMPLSGRSYLVAVARPGEGVSVADVCVFLARGDQGVNYAPGTWHHPLLALHATSDFLVIDRAGPGGNCDEVTLEPVGIIPA